MPRVYFRKDKNDGGDATFDAINQVSTESKMTLTGRVFLYLFIGIALTGIIAVGLPFLLIGLGATEIYSTLLTISIVGTVILGLLINFVILLVKSKPVQLFFYILYCIFWGILLSSLTLIFDLSTIGYAFLVTGVIFGVMGTYGYFTKKDLNGFGSVLMMILMSALIMSIVNIFIASTTLDWVISYVFLAVIVGFVAVDFNRVKHLNKAEVNDKTIALYLALALYSDFIYIFIRLVALIGSSRNR